MKASLGAQVMRGLSRGQPTFVTLPNGEKARIFWVTLEGPIGAGKTELFKILSPRLEEHFGKDRIFYVPEPIDELMSSGLFQDYQRDPKRWAFEFQTTFFDKRTDYFRAAYDVMIDTLQRTDVSQDEGHGFKTAIMLSERSIVSDTCFMRVQYQCGHCSEETLARYLSLNSKWRELYRGIAPGLIMYCRAGTETEGIVDICQQRIRERKREAEEDLVTPAYNKMVLQEHDRLFGMGSVFFAEGFSGLPSLAIPIVVVDTTANYRDDPRVAMTTSSELLDLIQSTFATEAVEGLRRPEIPVPPDDDRAVFDRLMDQLVDMDAKGRLVVDGHKAAQMDQDEGPRNPDIRAHIMAERARLGEMGLIPDWGRSKTSKAGEASRPADKAGEASRPADKAGEASRPADKAGEASRLAYVKHMAERDEAVTASLRFIGLHVKPDAATAAMRYVEAQLEEEEKHRKRMIDCFRFIGVIPPVDSVGGQIAEMHREDLLRQEQRDEEKKRIADKLTDIRDTVDKLKDVQKRRQELAWDLALMPMSAEGMEVVIKERAQWEREQFTPDELQKLEQDGHICTAQDLQSRAMDLGHDYGLSELEEVPHDDGPPELEEIPHHEMPGLHKSVDGEEDNERVLAQSMDGFAYAHIGDAGPIIQ